MSIEIACLCGDISVSLEGDPVTQIYCYCDDCQATHGAAYVGAALYPNDAVTVTKGTPVKWTYKTNTRSRCGTCGTILIMDPAGAPFKGVKADRLPIGTFKPEFHIQCEYAILPVVDSLPHFKAFPPQFGGSEETVDW